MGLVRSAARRLVAVAARLGPERGREWARAMLAELEFVEGEWEALWWALGSITVIARRSGQEWVRLCGAEMRRWERLAMDQMGKKTGLLVAGALGTAVLVMIAFALLYLTAVTFPQLGIEQAEWTHILVVIVIPAIICLCGAAWLWRRKRPLAVGILLSVVAVGTHVVLHFAHHFARR